MPPKSYSSQYDLLIRSCQYRGGSLKPVGSASAPKSKAGTTTPSLASSPILHAAIMNRRRGVAGNDDVSDDDEEDDD